MRVGGPAEVVKDVVRTFVIPSAERIFGRANLVRFARFMTNAVRLDVANDLRVNGESLVQQCVIRHAPAGAVVFDIGANIGDWSFAFLAEMTRASRDDIRLHAFEPCGSTCEMLSKRASQVPTGMLALHPFGMSDSTGTTSLYVVGDGVGINAVHRPEGAEVHRVEQVELRTIDSFVGDLTNEHILFVKSDAEGHDLHVLRGAREAIHSRAISVFQFEYNWRWIAARSYLHDVFDLVLKHAYLVGKITPRGVEWYERWDPELETFREGNYVVCKRECVSWFPAVRWWRLDAP